MKKMLEIRADRVQHCHISNTHQPKVNAMNKPTLIEDMNIDQLTAAYGRWLMYLQDKTEECSKYRKICSTTNRTPLDVEYYKLVKSMKSAHSAGLRQILARLRMLYAEKGVLSGLEKNP